MNNLLITGSTHFDDYGYLKSLMSKVKKPDMIVTGNSSGTDYAARKYAEEFHIPYFVLPINWYPNGEYDKGAGFRRNVKMVENCNSALIFWDCESKGTAQLISHAISKEKHIKVEYIKKSEKIITKDIKGFQNEFRWLSNMWPCTVKIGELIFQSAEAAYQATKFIDNKEVVAKFTKVPAVTAKKMSKNANITSEFLNKRLEYMEGIVFQKFRSNEYLKQLLLNTGDVYLEETNTWNDTFWGVCDGEGENNLGKILTSVRNVLKNEKNSCN